MKFLNNKWVKFAFVAILYILWVIWLENYWFFLGLAVIYDMYITEKVNWTFWKKRGQKKSKVVEWVDALIFAVVAATLIRTFFIEAFTIPTSSMEKSMLVGDYLFVSKATYGPKLPNTPLSFPFAHNTLPGTISTKSYLEWLELPYKRLAGWGKIERNDVVVFNFPAGDTVVLTIPDDSYYSIVRQYASKLQANDNIKASTKPYSYYANIAKDVMVNQGIVVRPVDKRTNYIKRCVAMPGDKIEIREAKVFINDKPQEKFVDIQYKYNVWTNGTAINPVHLQNIGISNEDIEKSPRKASHYVYPLTKEVVPKIEAFPNVESVSVKMSIDGERASYIFPHSPKYDWNEDFFGPLVIPKKGVTVQLSLDNLPLYRRIIHAYEGNKLEVRAGKIYINDSIANDYTFAMNYYFMMGDSRHNSADSRFWGFVPEDHVVGKAVFIWLSLNKDRGIFNGWVRWSRLFSTIK